MDEARPVTSPAERSALTRRRLLLGAGAVAAAGIGAVVTAPEASAAPTSFIRRSGANFTLDGRPWRFAGANCYYLHQKSNFMIDSVLGDAAAMGLRVMRTMAFADGTTRCAKSLQPAPASYNDAAFSSLDYTVYRCGQLGLRLVLPMVNNFTDFGGMAQYVQWASGLSVADAQLPTYHDLFYTNANIQQVFNAWVTHLLTHRNVYTGVRYCDDPTIMAWELANEPRCRTDRSGATLLGWADRTSRLVKQLAPNQLVGVGDEGFFGVAGGRDYAYSDYEGVKWASLTNLPAVDFGSVHVYPETYRSDLPIFDQVNWGTGYIRAHLDDPGVTKPVVLGEFGLVNPNVRDYAFDVWTRASENGGNGDLAWILTGRQDDGTLYPDYDGFRVVRPTTTTTQLAGHAGRMV